MNEEPKPQAAQNAPGFNDPIDNDDGGAERVFDITADLNISPVKDEPEEKVTSAGIAAIQFIPPKPRPSVLPSHTAPITPRGQTVKTTTTPVTPVVPVNPVVAAAPRPANPHPPVVTPLPVPQTPQVVPQAVPQPIPQYVPPIPPPVSVPPPVPPTPAPITPPPVTPVAVPVTPAAQPQPKSSAPTAAPTQAPTDKPSLATALADEIAETSHIPKLPATLTHLPQDPNIKPLRTYESDVAEAMARERSSLATMAIAESHKKEIEQAQPQNQQEEVVERRSPRPHGDGAKKAFLMLLILVFVGAGIIGAYYLYSKSPLAPATPVTPEQKVAPSLVLSESYAAIETDNLNANTLKSRIEREAAKSQAPGTIKEIIPTKTVGAQKMRVGGPEMIGLLDIPLPDILLRSLDRPMMIGVYADLAGEKSIFVVGTSAFFQNTFAGMLQWESIMADDLKYYLFPSDVRGVANVEPGMGSGDQRIGSAEARVGENAATSSAVTPPVPNPVPGSSAPVPYLTIRGHFVDRIIKNKDVRAFQNDAGETLFLYSFVDNNTKLVLTTAESTLMEILTRLEKARGLR